MSLLESPHEKGSPRHSSFSASPFSRPSRSTNDVPAPGKSPASQRGFSWASPAQKFPKFSLWSPAKAHKTKEFPFALTDRLYGYVYGESGDNIEVCCCWCVHPKQYILFHSQPQASDLQKTTGHHGSSNSKARAPCHPGKPVRHELTTFAYHSR